MTAFSMATSMAYGLRATAGPDAGTVFLLLHQRMTVGRSPAADIPIKEIYSARQRVAIVWSEETQAHWLEVRRHPVPVFHNGRPCGDACDCRLVEGDRIALGGSVFVYERVNVSEGSPSSGAGVEPPNTSP